MPDNPTSIPLSGAPPPGRIGHSHPASPAVTPHGATTRTAAADAVRRTGFGLAWTIENNALEGSF